MTVRFNDLEVTAGRGRAPREVRAGSRETAAPSAQARKGARMVSKTSPGREAVTGKGTNRRRRAFW